MQRQVAVVGLLILFGCCTNLVGQTPNIIVFMADDLGWTDISVASTSNGNQSDFYQTPTLEQIASQGMSFTNAYTCGANCAPTRAAFFTGQYAIRSTNNVFNVGSLNRGNNASNSSLIGPPQGLPNGEDQIPGAAITVAELLKSANYSTAHFGKFHVGVASGSNSVANQGFDANFGGNSSGAPASYFSNGSSFGGGIGSGLDPYAADYTSAQSQALTGSETLTGTRKHVTDAISEAIVDFVTDSQSSTGSPFFLHVGHYAVHTPINGMGRPDLVDKYQALPPGQNHSNAHYAALIEGIDQSIGQVLQFLQTTPDVNNPGQTLAETTMMIFYSDNGGHEGATENAPLRSHKGEYREGGIRVPLIAWMPGMIPADTVNATPVNSADFFPTLAELAEVDLGTILPGDYEPIDGENLLPILTDPANPLQREAIFWHFPGYLLDGNRDQRPQSIIRENEFKLVFNYESRSYELYDVVNDVGETANLIAAPQHQQTAMEMSAVLRQFLIDNNAVLPTYRDNGELVEYPDLFEGVETDTWDGGFGSFTDDNWNGGQPHPGSIVDSNSIELNSASIQVASGGVDSASLRIRTAGGFFSLSDAELTVSSTANLAGMDFGSLSGTSAATTAAFRNAAVSVSGSGSSARSLIVRNGSRLTVDNSTLSISHSSTDASRATLEIESNGILQIVNGSSITTEVLRIDNGGLGCQFESGTIILNHPHPIRSSSGFNGQLSFTGPGGQTSIMHTDLSESNLIRHLAGRVTNNFFAIDGTTISTAITYNGGNIAAINAELETLAVNGRYLQLAENAGQQILTLQSDTLLGDINLDGQVNLLDVAPFVALLSNGGFQLEADINGDGQVNLLDVGPFIELLSD